MKRIRFTAAVLACLTAVLTGTAEMNAAVPVKALDEDAIKKAEIAVCAVNDIRVQYGLSELAITPILLESSAIRAAELPVSFDHYRPDGTTCFTVLKSAGVPYTFVAENIAAGRSDAAATVQQWMASEGHRANILGKDYTHIGIGYSYAADSTFGHYWDMFLIGTYDGTEPYLFEDQYIPTRELGDPNGSKSINAADATVILEYAAAEAAGLYHPVVRAFKKAADVNANGEIDSVDASIILSYSAARGSGENVTLQDFVW